MLADLVEGELGLPPNTDSVVPDATGGRGRSVIADTVGVIGGLAAVSAERDAIGPSCGRR